VQVFEASTDFYAWRAEANREAEADPYIPLTSDCTVSTHAGCLETGRDLFGVDLCGVSRYHHGPDDTSFGYFAGPMLAKISLAKTDAFQKYVVEYSW